MKITQDGFDLIVALQSISMNSYRVANGKVFIGINHPVGEHEHDLLHPGSIDKERAYALLRRDLMIHEVMINRGLTVKLNQFQYEALVCHSFSTDVLRFLKSRLFRMVNSGFSVSEICAFWKLEYADMPYWKRHLETEYFRLQEDDLAMKGELLQIAMSLNPRASVLQYQAPRYIMPAYNAALN